MILNLQQIKLVTTGAVRIEQECDGIHFYRFTKEQEEMFLPRSRNFYDYTFSTPGIRLRFRTNSPWLALKFYADYASPRSFFSVDISVDGVLLQGVDNYPPEAVAENYVETKYPCGLFHKQWVLGEGEKEIQVYLPWSVKFVLQELSLADGSALTPTIPTKKMLSFGDSITHGADALHPSKRYVSRFSDYLNAVEYCKAICGEFFWPELAKTREDFSPDYITVAYGTNDWSKTSPEEIKKNCFGFCRNLAETYPDAKIIAITPLWRADEQIKDREIPLRTVHELICQAVQDNPNAIVISGCDAVPHDPTYFADLRLHPGDKGFECYYDYLVGKYEKRTMK